VVLKLIRIGGSCQQYGMNDRHVQTALAAPQAFQKATGFAAATTRAPVSAMVGYGPELARHAGSRRL
jgi:hypothetical protein